MKNIFKHIKGDFFGGLTAGIVALTFSISISEFPLALELQLVYMELYS